MLTNINAFSIFCIKKKKLPKKEEIDIKFTISLMQEALQYRYYAKSTYNIIVVQPPDSPR